MTRITVHTTDNAPETVRPELAVLAQQFGKVLNIHGAMAYSPVVIHAYVAFQQVIVDYGTFDSRTREAIALVVGNVNECTYCQSAHTISAKTAGLSEDQTIAIRKGTVDFETKLAVLLELARQSTANKGTVKDDAWQAALDAGWTDAELTELSAHIAVNLFTNYFNHLVETDLDVPAAPRL
jgi:AhpD family alkylhydroperoxidase